MKNLTKKEQIEKSKKLYDLLRELIDTAEELDHKQLHNIFAIVGICMERELTEALNGYLLPFIVSLGIMEEREKSEEKRLKTALFDKVKRPKAEA